MSIFLNYTPHVIRVIESNDSVHSVRAEIPSSGLARVKRILLSSSVENAEFGPVKVSQYVYGEIEGLPAAKEGVYLIVSSVVIAANDANLLDKRTDLICPDELVRNDKGDVLGCRCFSR